MVGNIVCGFVLIVECVAPFAMLAAIVVITIRELARR